MKNWTRILALALLLSLVLTPMAQAEESVYPLEDGGTLSIWCTIPAGASAYIANLGENIAYQVMQENIGVNFEFIHPPSGQATESFNLLVASGDVPDIMVQPSYVGGEAGGVLDGVFADLTDYVPLYAPYYQSYLDSSDEFRKLSTTPDGRIYATYNYKDQYEPYYVRAQFREDLLEKYGLRIPETIAEYEAFFEAVLADPEVDMAPFALPNDGVTGGILCAWDIGIIHGSSSADAGWFVMGDEVHYGFYEPEFKEYLQLMADWYAKGYISKDFMTANTSTLYQTEKIASLVINGYNLNPIVKELGVPMTSGRYVRFNEGDLIHTERRYFHNNGGTTYVSGKADEKTLITALRVLDYGYSPEGILLWNFGPEGITWDEVDENGFPIYNDFMLNNPNYPINNAEHILRPHGSGMSRFRYGDGVSFASNQKDPENWAYRERWSDDETVDTSYGIPPYSLSADADERLAQIMNNVNTHAKEMTLKYITGAADFANFDVEYTQVLEAFGMQEAIDIKQNGFNEYLAK